jgi:cell pole-organizing protein PopZ
MTAAAGDPPDQDQSMDDILASIRRIMLDEQARLQDSPGALAYATGRAAAASTDPVLILDSSMVVDDGPPQSLAVSLAEETVIMVSSEGVEGPPVPAPGETIDARDAGVTGPAAADAAPTDAETGDTGMPLAREPEPSAQTTILGATGAVQVEPDPGSPQVVISAQAIEALMAPAAAAAAAASVEALLKQLSEERLAAIKPAPPASPTIDDVVRAELRPFLKAWLDEHLPAMVEGLVRAEITRLIGRSGF